MGFWRKVINKVGQLAKKAAKGAATEVATDEEVQRTVKELTKTTRGDKK